MTLNGTDLDWHENRFKIVVKSNVRNAAGAEKLESAFASTFMAVPNKFVTVMSTSGGTSLREAFANASKSTKRSLSIGTLEHDA